MKRAAAMLAGLALLAGCGVSPDPRLYVLNRVAPVAVTQTPGLALMVRRVGIPAYAERQEIVRQIGPVGVRRAPMAHWAGPLDTMLTSVLAADLRARLDGAAVTDETSPIAPPPGAVTVAVQITRMGMDGQGRVLLVAEYATGSGRPYLGRFAAVAADDTVAAYVTALDRAVGALADRIAARLETGGN